MEKFEKIFNVIIVILSIMTLYINGMTMGKIIEQKNTTNKFNKIQEEYNTLQTQYDRDLSTCRTLLSDIQNRVQKGQACYVDGGNNCE